MAKLGVCGQTWRPWPSLTSVAKLGDSGQAWRLWPSLATMAKLDVCGQAWSTESDTPSCLIQGVQAGKATKIKTTNS
ncbi:hypothetical protein SFRURICE_017552 [Spodoptera frugiperda]|nr:hypothetical protein SFRURICE_017552 [Spodoptera frugiperda]